MPEFESALSLELEAPEVDAEAPEIEAVPSAEADSDPPSPEPDWLLPLPLSFRRMYELLDGTGLKFPLMGYNE